MSHLALPSIAASVAQCTSSAASSRVLIYCTLCPAGVDDDYDGDGGGGGGGDTLVTVGGAGCRPAEQPTLVSMVSAVPQEYSYFDQPRLLAWAGPKHWKHRMPASAGESLGGGGVI